VQKHPNFPDPLELAGIEETLDGTGFDDTGSLPVIFDLSQ